MKICQISYSNVYHIAHTHIGDTTNENKKESSHH